MCWVMPPASPAATSVSRMASSSEVLPWSTWPRMVITGGRSSRVDSSSSYSGSATTSSAACWISILRSRPSASTSIASSERVWVSVAISPSSISFLMTSGAAMPSDSATSLTVAPDWTGEIRSSSGASGLAVRSGSTHGVRRRRPRRRGGWFCCGGGPGARREAWESMTTPAALAAGASAAASVRVGRCWARRLGGGAVAVAAGLLGRGLLRRRVERTRDVALVDARGGGLHVQACGLQGRQDLLRGDPALLRYLMDSLLRHLR